MTQLLQDISMQQSYSNLVLSHHDQATVDNHLGAPTWSKCPLMEQELVRFVLVKMSVGWKTLTKAYN
jgi:hypothetical protein